MKLFHVHRNYRVKMEYMQNIATTKNLKKCQNRIYLTTNSVCVCNTLN